MWFQFHDGTITTSSGKSLGFINPLFQFHDGTITTVGSISDQMTFSHVSIPWWYDYNPLKFYLQRTDNVVSIPWWYDYNEKTAQNIHNIGLVSIPWWYDYNDPINNIQLVPIFVSIPWWYDYNKTLCTDVRPNKQVSIPWWYDYNAVEVFKTNELQTSFNSMMVRLQRRSYLFPFNLINCFNSMMVRLQLAMCLKTSCLKRWFQFHDGTITTKSGYSGRDSQDIVSIPWWYDYNMEPWSISGINYMVSIPWWYDYNHNPIHNS